MALNSNFRTLTADNIEGIVDEKNYLKSSFENGTTVGWTEMNVTLTSGLPTGTPTISASAAGSFELSTTTTQPLSGSRSLLVNVPTGLGVGDGFISQEFTLDRMDYGKVLTVSFDYERVSGTYNFSGVRGSQTWLVYVYDATAGGANWIQPAGFLGMNQSQGPGRVSCTFQSSVVSGQKYRVAVIASQAAAGASSIKFDNFTCSRQPVSVGTPVTDWQSYTPTFQGFGTPTSVQFQWRRVGADLEVRGKFTSGTSTATEGRVSFPSGLTSADTSLIPSLQTVGVGATSVTASNTRSVLIEPSVTYFTFGIATAGPLAKQNGSMLLGSGDTFAFFGKVPISGWSSSVQTSDSADTRVVACRYFSTTSQSITASVTNINFPTRESDTHAAFDGTTFTAPVTGYYQIFGTLSLSAATTISVSAYINGTISSRLSYYISNSFPAFAGVVFLNAGQALTFRGDNNATINGGGVNGTCISINRLSGPSAIAASETVAASYWASANGTASTATPFNYDSKEYDTHLAVTTGASWKFTAPVSGKYTVKTYLNISAVLAANADIRLYKNGSAFGSMGWQTSSAACSAIITLNLLAGDYIDIRSAVSNYTYYGNATRSTLGVSAIQIERVGN